ncbi:MAG: hypothetical protein KF760_09970 [Candidatus Eremiobacteraeota bacterium]|nr:hypothetical protein [Candidatus Eremiobacteraeota bacterium]MCW5868916.1 hypothetical protein [Candidatus Eremiobacteraeota bacterium]
MRWTLFSLEDVRAAMDPRVALHYTAQRSPEVSTGLSLRSYTGPEQPLHISLRGGTSLEDALNKAYGNPSQPEETGMGCMEKITRDSSADLGQLVVNRRAALDDLQARGLVRWSWSPKD